MFNAISLSIPITYFPNVCKIFPKNILIDHKIKIKQNHNPKFLVQIVLELS